MPTPVKPSQSVYPYAHWYFALAIITTWVGFSQSYFSRLGKVTIFHHLHGATAGLWMVLVIVQPVLYHRGKISLHRQLGRIATYTLVPLLIIGGFVMMRLMIINKADYPPGAVYQLAYIDLYSLILFPLFFCLGIKYAKQVNLHARYMACTVLVLLPPAITRMLFLIPWFDSFNKTLNASFIIIELILLLLFWDDRKTTGRIQKTYQLAMVLFVLLHITMNYAGNWPWWQHLMNAYAGL